MAEDSAGFARSIYPYRSGPSPLREDQIEVRRMLVTRLRLRGLSANEITVALGSEVGLRNPDTDQPYSYSTILSDLDQLGKEWRRLASQDLADHKGRIFFELQEAKRQAWSNNDLKNLLEAIKQERELLGVDEIKITGVIVGTEDSLAAKLTDIAARMGKLPPGHDPSQSLPTIHEQQSQQDEQQSQRVLAPSLASEEFEFPDDDTDAAALPSFTSVSNRAQPPRSVSSRRPTSPVAPRFAPPREPGKQP